jgi:hypothetical protein
LGILGYCILFEHSSLRAFGMLARDFSKTLQKRKAIQQRRRADDAYMKSWFRFRATSRPMENAATTADEAIRVAKR